MTQSIFKPLAIALLLGVAPLSISTAYAVVAATGPAGPAGPTGAKGDQGNQGDQGARGANGTNGTNGANSTVPGPKGDSGTAAIRAIGDSYAGGIVFWVDASGEHGLIAARADQSTGVQWYNNVYKLTGTIGDGGVYAGAMNTALIIAQQTANAPGGGYFAAKVAANYSVQENGTSACTGAATEICYGDWYLPSKVELNLLYQQKSVVGGFADGYYWSSSEYAVMYAKNQNFYNGDYDGDDGKEGTLLVRAVRAF